MPPRNDLGTSDPGLADPLTDDPVADLSGSPVPWATDQADSVPWAADDGGAPLSDTAPTDDDPGAEGSLDPGERELGPGAQLRDADLRGADLSGIDLTGADLTRADLTGASGTGTCLKAADLHEAVLDGVVFVGADLTDADLTHVSATGAAFGGCRLDRASMFGAILDNSTFSHASLIEADLRMGSARDARFRGTDLTGVELSRADLTEADLSTANVANAIFREADLHGARLASISGYRSTDWIGCNVTHADFTGALLAQRQISDQNYLHEFRSQSRFHEWIYKLWWLSSDCGRSYARWSVWTVLVALLFAGLYRLVDIHYADAHEETLLSSLYYSIVTLTTLGYGDAYPVSPAAQVVAMAQVIVGYVMLGGLLSIFSSKMSRRGA